MAVSRCVLRCVLAFGLCAAVLVPPARATGRPQDDELWWIEQYGKLDASRSPAAARAERVFERVRRVAAKRDSRSPSLVLIDTPEVRAVALPGGAVVVSRGALELCYGTRKAGQRVGSKEGQRGDIRIGFVLGHEIAHLVRDDFLSPTSFSADGAVLQGMQWNNELRADSEGLQSLWWAGYDPGELLREDGAFFHQWYAAVLPPGLQIGSHPPAEERAASLAERAGEITEALPYFHFGVRLLELGRHQDALRLLEQFKKPFASREVLSNLGVAHLEIAARILARCDGRLVIRFKLPAVIDPETLADRSRRRGVEQSPCFENPAFQRAMDQALRDLEAAREMDPGYAPAAFNLFAAYVLSGRTSEALPVAKALAEHFPGDPRALAAQALAVFLFGEDNGVDMADEALDRFQAIQRQHPELADVLYNQAAINKERLRLAAAAELWKAFLRLEPSGPHADYARERLGAAAPPPPPSPVVATAPPSPVPLGDVDSMRRELRGLERTRFEAGDLRGAFWDGGGVKALQIGSHLEIVEERLEPPLPVDDLGARYGPPAHILELAAGHRLLRYPGFALDVEDGQVRAVVHFVEAQP